MKKSFSFLELLVVIFLIAILYGVFFSNINFKFKKKKETLTFHNLKSFLLKNYNFSTKLTLVCLQFEDICYVHLDGVKDKKNMIQNFLSKEFQVFSYEKEYKKREFKPIEFKSLESYDVKFKYNIVDNKSDAMIIKNDKNIILLHAIEKPTILSSLTDINDYFDSKIVEVKDAF